MKIFNSLMRRQTSPHERARVVLAKPHPSALPSSLSTQLPYALSFFLFPDQFPCQITLYRFCFHCHLAPFLSFFHASLFLSLNSFLFFHLNFIAQDSEKLSPEVLLGVSWISALFFKLFFSLSVLSFLFAFLPSFLCHPLTLVIFTYLLMGMSFGTSPFCVLYRRHI